MSGERSSSGVRNLRSLFENKSNDNGDLSRSSSPGGVGFESEHRPRSKVRTSFFPVEPPRHASFAKMASAPDFSKVPNAEMDAFPSLHREASGRRPSFSEDSDSTAVQQLKNTVADEAKRRESVPVAETIPETAVETPSAEPDKQVGGDKKDSKMESTKQQSSLKQELKPVQPHKVEKEAENPDKVVTGAEEEPADMKPSQPTSEKAVSGGEALPAVAEDLRKPTSAGAKAGAKPSTTKAASKPATISTKGAPRPSTSAVRPLRATSSASTTSPTSSSAKPGRSSLSAPTAASVARATAAEKAATTASKPAAGAPKPKPRDVTKPAELPSRLTAPTAASRAKHETSPAPSKPVTANRTKTPATASRSARPSLGPPDSRSSQSVPAKKTTTPVDSSFLERMSRPTAASSNRLKTEEKEQPRSQKLATRPKTNGPATSAKTAKAKSSENIEESTFIEEPSVVHEGEEVAAPTAQAQKAAAENRAGSPVTELEPNAATVESTGKETPNTNGDGHHFEGTPSALGVEESIR